MTSQFEKKEITKKSENISEWYNDVVLKTELADYGPARGTMIFRPYGWAIWEEVQRQMDKEIKARGVQNAYFPLFIPESLLKKEKEHVEGFSPQLAVVTIGGGEELKEKLIVRPTSETIMYDAYSRWIHSWRDLPLLINQWNNVVRWEKRTYLFLRTTEFLWQEGHTAHATHREAWDTAVWAMEMYSKIYREVFAIAGCVGKKSELEKFAGADVSLSYEALMPDGKALQAATSHDLGQNFSKVFDIRFQDKEGIMQYVWQTSWGLSTRSIGGLILVHGDDQGLRLPPKLAPIQVVILPVKVNSDIVGFSKKVAASLKEAGVRVFVDSTEDETLGYRINKWELKGVPVRIEVGQKELVDQSLTLVRRDTGDKLEVKAGGVMREVVALLDKIQNTLYQEAQEFLEENTHGVENYDEFKSLMKDKRGFLLAFWCESAKCEEKIKVETKATTRVLPLDASSQSGVCVYCGGPAKHRWYFAQAY